MFGSLVIAYPTPHVGGVLRFTKDDKSWSLDSGADLTAQQEPSIAYAVFFSDTDHEVLPVTSGHRVTVTYNLYLASATGEESVDSTAVSQMAENEVALATILESLLAKDDFLPRGGLMGFGLQYQYAVVAHGEVQDILERLKGVDAAVLSACRQLQLGVQIKAVGKTGSHEWLVDEVPRMDSSYYDGEGPSDTLAHGLLIKSYDSDATMSDMFTWVTSLTKNARSATQTFGTYGNEASLATLRTAVPLADAPFSSPQPMSSMRICAWSFRSASRGLGKIWRSCPRSGATRMSGATRWSLIKVWPAVPFPCTHQTFIHALDLEVWSSHSRCALLLDAALPLCFRSVQTMNARESRHAGRDLPKV
jgi:hypothetical protein